MFVEKWQIIFIVLSICYFVYLIEKKSKMF